jgi:DNA-binding NarL/FixJ family response regulator
MQILTMVSTGCSNAQVARALAVSPATVATHPENVYQRLDVRSGAAAVAKVLPIEHPPAKPLTG